MSRALWGRREMVTGASHLGLHVRGRWSEEWTRVSRYPNYVNLFVLLNSIYIVLPLSQFYIIRGGGQITIKFFFDYMNI